MMKEIKLSGVKVDEIGPRDLIWHNNKLYYILTTSIVSKKAGYIFTAAERKLSLFYKSSSFDSLPEIAVNNNNEVVIITIPFLSEVPKLELMDS